MGDGTLNTSRKILVCVCCAIPCRRLE